MAFHLKEKPCECDFCQNGFSENKKAKLILVMDFQRMAVKDEASLSGGLPWCAFGDCLSLKMFLGKLLLIRLLFQVNCRDVLLETALLWKSSLAKLTLMRLLFQMDCHDVLLETAFLWKSILAKLPLMRLLFQIDCRDVLWMLPFSENLFWQNSSSWGFSFRWTAVM